MTRTEAECRNDARDLYQAGEPMSPLTPALALALLDIAGWRPVFFVATNAGDLEEGDENDADTALRCEHWIVSADQYVFTVRATPSNEWGPLELGEWSFVEDGESLDVRDVERLLVIARRARDAGVEVHPALLALLKPLTNCDTCAHDYTFSGHRMCRKVDGIYATESDSDELFDWVAVNCDDDGAPSPDATGCPDHEVRS